MSKHFPTDCSITQKRFAVTFFKKVEGFSLIMLWAFLFCFYLPGLSSSYYGFQFCILWGICVYVWVCMLYICFLYISLGSFNLCFVQFCFVLFYFIIFRCLFRNERARKGLDLCEWEGGEDLGGVSGRETGIRIYCLKKQSIFNFLKKWKIIK